MLPRGMVCEIAMAVEEKPRFLVFVLFLQVF